MEHYNQQILAYWDGSELAAGNREKKANMVEAMAALKFAAPVQDREELEEVAQICMLYQTLRKQGVESFVAPFAGHKVLHVAWSVTERCGHLCHHCSTQGSLAQDKQSVPWDKLEQALREMAPYTQMLYISCEGDPFYYEDRSATLVRDISDVTGTIVKLGFPHLSLQSLAPATDKLGIMAKLLAVLPDPKSRPNFFFPQLSFNLYPPRAGLNMRSMNNEHGTWQQFFVPGIADSELKDWIVELVKSLGDKSIARSGADQTVTERLSHYLQEVKAAILAYASRGYPIVFEIRGDVYSSIHNLQTLDEILDMLVANLAQEHPEIPFPKCEHCDKVHYAKEFAPIVPLGRATQLFPNGAQEEVGFFAKHVAENPYRYLCDNWQSWGAVTIDTKGFPQLCYSNLALTPQARTTQGPNLYSGKGFAAIREFYLQVWRDRARFLLQHLPELVRQRPNSQHCPLCSYKQTLAHTT